MYHVTRYRKRHFRMTALLTVRRELTESLSFNIHYEVGAAIYSQRIIIDQLLIGYWLVNLLVNHSIRTPPFVVCRRTGSSCPLIQCYIFIPPIFVGQKPVTFALDQVKMYNLIIIKLFDHHVEWPVGSFSHAMADLELRSSAGLLADDLRLGEDVGDNEAGISTWSTPDNFNTKWIIKLSFGET